jgi:hypothetical protein
MSKEPVDRYKDAAAFRRVLQRYSPATASQTGLKVTRYGDPSLSFGLSSMTPLQLVVSDTKKSRSRRPLLRIAGLSLLVLFVIGGIIYHLSSDSSLKQGARPTPVTVPISVPNPEPPAAPPPPKPEPAKARVTITVTPAEAAVYVDGTRVGSGSVVHEVVVTQTPHDVEVSAPGYDPYKNSLVLDKDVVIEITLAQTAPPSAAPATNRARPKTKKPVGKREEKKKDKPEIEVVDKPDTAPAPTRTLRAIDEVNPW